LVAAGTLVGIAISGHAVLIVGQNDHNFLCLDSRGPINERTVADGRPFRGKARALDEATTQRIPHHLFMCNGLLAIDKHFAMWACDQYITLR
jgi:hypothetical protein